jgi:hypothetical protein
LPPDHRSLSLAEKWAGLAAIHDAYWKGDKIDPLPKPTENWDLTEWLPLWPDNVTWRRTDVEAWGKWCTDGGSTYHRLIARVGKLADADKPFVDEWLRDVKAGSAPDKPKAPAAVRKSTAAGCDDLLTRDPPEVVGYRPFGIEIPDVAPPAAIPPETTTEPPATELVPDATAAEKGAGPRDAWFLKMYEAEGTKTHHSPKTIYETWNAMGSDKRREICPGWPAEVAKLETVEQAIKRAKKPKKQ